MRLYHQNETTSGGNTVVNRNKKVTHAFQMLPRKMPFLAGTSGSPLFLHQPAYTLYVVRCTTIILLNIYFTAHLDIAFLFRIIIIIVRVCFNVYCCDNQ